MAAKDLQKQPAKRGPGKRFEPGQSGNPAGRKVGSRNKATMAAQALIDGKSTELINKALELALKGDGPVLRALLDRLCPTKRDAPVSISLPSMETPADLPRVTGAIMQAAAEGKITPSEAAALAALVEGHRKALETADLAERVAKLEEFKGL